MGTLLDNCFKDKELSPKTCRFIKKCKDGYYRNETYKCRKNKKSVKKVPTPITPKVPTPISPKVPTPITPKVPTPITPKVPTPKTLKNINSVKQMNKSPKTNDLKNMKKAVIEFKETPTKQYKTIYPENYEMLEENGKKYIIFKNGGDGIMLAGSLYKDKKMIELNKKQLLQHINPPIGWYASEKYDGLRGLWTGKYLVARPKKTDVLKGKIFNYCPDWFMDLLPSGISLDGEIWLGRGKFQEIAGLSNLKISTKNTKEELDKIWKKVKYVVFDIPSEKNKPFTERMEILKKIIDDIAIKYGPDCPIMHPPNTLIDSNETLIELYNKYTQNGAEGLILREPNSLYENKRSNLMLKMKINDDGEAIVIDFENGKGRLEGLLGSIKCKLKNGKTFNIGSGLNDIIRKEYNDPDSIYHIPLGSIVNFSYMEKTNDGIPRHPIFRGVRKDVVL